MQWRISSWLWHESIATGDTGRGEYSLTFLRTYSNRSQGNSDSDFSSRIVHVWDFNTAMKLLVYVKNFPCEHLFLKSYDRFSTISCKIFVNPTTRRI